MAKAARRTRPDRSPGNHDARRTLDDARPARDPGRARDAPAREARSQRAQRRAAAQRHAQRRRLVRIGLPILAGIIVVALGAWWSMARSGPANSQALYQFETQDFHSLAFHPEDPDTLLFGHHYGLMVSADGGKSWQEGTLQDVDVMQLAIPPADPDRIYVTGHDVFIISHDGGQTWQPPPHNLPDLDIHGFAASPSNPDQVYAFEVRSGGLFASADGGETWAARSLPPGLQGGMLSLVVAPEDAQHLFAGVGTQIAESRDGGQTWQEHDGPGGMIIAMASDPRTPDTLYIGTDEAVWKRTDDTWQRLPVEPEGVVLALAVSPSQLERIALIDQAGHLYRSDDGGQTWINR